MNKIRVDKLLKDKLMEQIKKGDYNPNVDYEEAINQFNKLIECGKRKEAGLFTGKYGGIIAMILNRERQREERRKLK